MAERTLEESFKSPRFYVLRYIAYYGPTHLMEITRGLEGKTSKVTIRNVLNELEKEGILKSTLKRGGKLTLPYDFTEDSLWIKELLLKPESYKAVIERQFK